MCQWFTNRRLKSSIPIAALTMSPKRPRATNTELVFRKTAIQKEVSKRSQTSEYNSVQKQHSETGVSWESSRLKPRSYSFTRKINNFQVSTLIWQRQNKCWSAWSRNQNLIVNNVLRALQELIGWNWGQHGDIVFFVQGKAQAIHTTGK